MTQRNGVTTLAENDRADCISLPTEWGYIPVS